MHWRGALWLLLCRTMTCLCREAVDILDLRVQDSGPRPVRIPVVVRVSNVLEAIRTLLAGGGNGWFS